MARNKKKKIKVDSDRKIIWVSLLLALLVLAIYAQAYKFQFVNYDDSDYFWENPHIKVGLTGQTIVWAFTKYYAGNWHPVTWLSLALDSQLFGPGPIAPHIHNVILHLANTLLLFWILLKVTGRLCPSCFVAALFAIHPLNVESVAWVSERKNVLSTFFLLLTVAMYFRYVKLDKLIWYFLMLFVFALGLMAKPMLVTLPFALLLLDYWPLERLQLYRRSNRPSKKTEQKYEPLSRLILEKLPLLALAVLSSVVTFYVQRAGGYMAAKGAYPLPIRLINMPISYVEYIKNMFWPAGLAPFYPHPGQNGSVPLAIAATVVMIAITIFVVMKGRKFKYLITGWLWYLGTMVPVIGLVQVGDQAMADRYCYVPLIGLFIIVAWGLADISTKLVRYKNLFSVAAVTAVLILAICCGVQASYWHDSIRLFEHAIEVTEGNYLAHFALIKPLRNEGRPIEEVIAHAREAVRIAPNYVEANNELGNSLIQRGGKSDIAEAIGCLQRAVNVNPDFAPAHSNLCVAFTQTGRIDEAIKHGNEAVRLGSENSDCHFNLGIALYAKGRIDAAIAEWQKAVELQPSNCKARNNLAAMLYQQGKIDEAIEHWRQVLIHDPNDGYARSNLNRALQTLSQAKTK